MISDIFDKYWFLFRGSFIWLGGGDFCFCFSGCLRLIEDFVEE